MKDDIIVKTSDITAFITEPVDLDSLKAKVIEVIGS
jgi:hypothetical protein